MNRTKTEEYYRNLSESDLCQCNECRNFRRHVRKAYPDVSAYLNSFGVSIEKPHESWAIETDENGSLSYMDVQYVIFGKKEDFRETKINDVRIRLAEAYPPTGIDEEHFVIEMDPFDLKMDL